MNKTTLADARKVAAFLEPTDLPPFVADLLKGVFDANLRVTKEQTEAYVALMKEAARQVDTFTQENDPATRRARQQLLATMVLMGVNRIGVTDGKIQAPVKFKIKKRKKE